MKKIIKEWVFNCECGETNFMSKYSGKKKITEGTKLNERKQRLAKFKALCKCGNLFKFS